MPTIQMPICFWCGRDMVDAAAFAGSTIERAFMGYGFCERCRAFALGKIVCIEVAPPEEAGNPPFTPGPPLDKVAPTGRWMVVEPEAFATMPFPAGCLATAMVPRHVMIEGAIFNKVIPPQVVGDSGGSE
jgi:hypothetical protein